MKRRDVQSMALPAGVDPHAVRPYGDALDDGLVQVSFSLPVPLCPESVEAARRLCGQMGLKEPSVYHQADLGHGFSFYIVYGKLKHAVDFGRIVVPQVTGAVASFEEINDRIRTRLGRRIRVVGACTGSDAHTVGIDAIMNMKGYNHRFGLERYPMVEAHNLGAQVPNERLIEFSRRVGASGTSAREQSAHQQHHRCRSQRGAKHRDLTQQATKALDCQRASPPRRCRMVSSSIIPVNPGWKRPKATPSFSPSRRPLW